MFASVVTSRPPLSVRPKGSRRVPSRHSAATAIAGSDANTNARRSTASARRIFTIVPSRHVGHLRNLRPNEHAHDLGGYQTAERPERDVERQIEGETGEENGPRNPEHETLHEVDQHLARMGCPPGNHGRQDLVEAPTERDGKQVEHDARQDVLGNSECEP